MISFFVKGHPSAQGSKRHVGKGIMLDTNPQLKSWRGAVAQACPMEAPLNGPVQLRLEFTSAGQNRTTGKRINNRT